MMEKKFGAEGAKAFATALQTYSTLQVVFMCGNHIGAEKLKHHL
jgi:hypothetical protein